MLSPCLTSMAKATDPCWNPCLLGLQPSLLPRVYTKPLRRPACPRRGLDLSLLRSCMEASPLARYINLASLSRMCEAAALPRPQVWATA